MKYVHTFFFCKIIFQCNKNITLNILRISYTGCLEIIAKYVMGRQSGLNRIEKSSFCKFPQQLILILKDSRIHAHSAHYCEVYRLPIAWRAGRGSWGLADKRPAPRTPLHNSDAALARLSLFPMINNLACMQYILTIAKAL